MMKRKKILAVASICCNWIHLLRICKGLENKSDLAFASTHE